jgi:hypothetical protein
VHETRVSSLPAYNYAELFNDHPGTYQDIATNDSVTKQIVDFIMNNPAYKDNTLIVVTEDDTQNGNNGPDVHSGTGMSGMSHRAGTGGVASAAV